MNDLKLAIASLRQYRLLNPAILATLVIIPLQYIVQQGIFPL